MRVLALLFGAKRPIESVCLEHLRAKRLAEVEALLAEIAERHCDCST